MIIHDQFLPIFRVFPSPPPPQLDALLIAHPKLALKGQNKSAPWQRLGFLGIAWGFLGIAWGSLVIAWGATCDARVPMASPGVPSVSTAVPMASSGVPIASRTAPLILCDISRAPVRAAYDLSPQDQLAKEDRPKTGFLVN